MLDILQAGIQLQMWGLSTHNYPAIRAGAWMTGRAARRLNLGAFSTTPGGTPSDIISVVGNDSSTLIVEQIVDQSTYPDNEDNPFLGFAEFAGRWATDLGEVDDSGYPIFCDW